MPTTSVTRARVKPAPTKRTASKGSAATRRKSDVIDIDAALEEEGEGPKDLDEIETAEITVFGEKFRVLKAINIMNFLGLDSDDPDDTARALDTVRGMIHDDDWKRFRNAYARQRNLSGKAFGIIVTRMIQAASGVNPTDSSSGSGRTASKATSRQLSAAN